SIFGLEGLACHVNVNVVAAAAFWRRSPVDSNSAAAKAAPCKILLRITANLTRVCVAKSAPQRVAMDTNLAFLFPPGERDPGLADYSSTPAFINLGRYVTQPLLGPTSGHEIIADRLHAQGWSYGIAEHLTKHGFHFCVDAHRDGKRFIVKADDLL